jgi:predicted nuclease of predicted toxin-antitoxin system
VFIELYLDEDVSVLVAELLRARGFSVITTREAGQLGSSDADQLAYAVSQRRALLTHNRVDFESLAQTYFSPGRSHSGIIMAVRHSPYEIVRRLLVVLDQVTADEFENQVRYV